ncbi:unnamed protein product [Arabis nemorensis]|uniref:Uncharacterized protein n=1 Tax=Arabis nemorensis TaxID=586526 RepID=A0A565C0S8_9BRAS|nr:unnamed protein product [Arabis nemorensis]
MVAVTVAVINHIEIADITVLFHVCACVVTGGEDTMTVKKFVFADRHDLTKLVCFVAAAKFHGK